MIYRSNDNIKETFDYQKENVMKLEEFEGSEYVVVAEGLNGKKILLNNNEIAFINEDGNKIDIEKLITKYNK